MKQLVKFYGITLIELLIALSITAIIGMLALPSLDNLIQSSRSSAATNQLSGLLSLARNEAVSRNMIVTLCPSLSGLACEKTAWQDGIILFTDRNGNAVVDQNDEIKRAITPFLRHGVLSFRSLRQRVQFDGRGASRGSAGSFIYCPDNQDERFSKALIISFQGRVRKGPDSNGDGIPESGNRKNIAC